MQYKDRSTAALFNQIKQQNTLVSVSLIIYGDTKQIIMQQWSLLGISSYIFAATKQATNRSIRVIIAQHFIKMTKTKKLAFFIAHHVKIKEILKFYSKNSI